MKTTIVNPKDVVRAWYLVDAADQPAGRLAVKVTAILRGKNKPAYTPHVDMGDFVVIVNAEKVKLTGSKEELKIYKDYSGFPSGLKLQSAATVRRRNPGRIVTQAVKGMLPKNKMASTMMTRLKVYVGSAHPHAAQNPQPLAV
jgi:large subunit ribosomal protein L13